MRTYFIHTVVGIANTFVCVFHTLVRLLFAEAPEYNAQHAPAMMPSLSLAVRSTHPRCPSSRIFLAETTVAALLVENTTSLL